MSAIQPLSDQLATQILNGLLWDRGAIADVSPVRSALFGPVSPNVIKTPGAKSVTLELKSSRTLDRAGLDANPDGDARWAPRTLMTWYPRTEVTLNVKFHKASDAQHDWDFTNYSQLDPTQQANAVAYQRMEEMDRREAITTDHARFWEKNCLGSIFGEGLDFTSTGFTARQAVALPAAMGLGGTAISATNFNVPLFARAMMYDLRLQTSGASDRVDGAVWVITPELAKAWASNTYLRGIFVSGTSGAGFAMLKDPIQNQVLTEEALITALKQLDGVRDAVIAKGFADMSALGSSAASNDYLVGSQKGLAIIVQDNVSSARQFPGSNVIKRKSTGLVEQVHFEGDIQVERYMQQGFMYYADAAIGHTVADPNFGEIIYDAA